MERQIIPADKGFWKICPFRLVIRPKIIAYNMLMNNNLEEVYYSNKYERIDILLLKLSARLEMISSLLALHRRPSSHLQHPLDYLLLCNEGT